MMHYRQLGRTGLVVSELCLGAMTFGGAAGLYKPINGVDQKLADAIVEKALEGGVNFIDTADTYSSGESERILGQSLKTLGVKRSDIVIATKFSSVVGPGPNDRGSSRGHIMDAVAASLDRLGLDHIDLYQVHTSDSFTPEEETLRALDDLISQRLVRYIGCSNWSAWKTMKALGISDRRGWARFDTVQAYYSLAGRDIEREIVPMMADQGVGLLVWSPLAGGLLSGKFDATHTPEDARRARIDFPPVLRERAWPCVEAMRKIAGAHDSTVARVALAWILSKNFVTSIVIGVSSVGQLEDNLGAVDLILSAAEIAELDAISELPSEYPEWMNFQREQRVPTLASRPAAPSAG